MNLLQRMKVWRELKQLEQRVREEPAPATFVDLGQVHINLELLDKAERIAEDGLSLFPKSIELRQLLDTARRGIRRRRMDELRAQLVRTPDVAAFTELAGLQVELGDLPGLQRTCQDWGVRFPHDPGSWRVQARAHLVSYYRDLGSREGAEAVRCLEMAIERAPEDAPTRLMLAELLMRLGAVRRAEAQVAAALQSDPKNAAAAGLQKHLTTLCDEGDDVDALLADVEAHGALRHPMPAAAAMQSSEESFAGVRDSLGDVTQIPGVRKAAFIRGTKAMVRGAVRDGRDPFLRTARVVGKAMQRFARRLDIGQANKSVVEGGFGAVCVCAYGDAMAAAQCDSGAEFDKVLAALQEVVAGALAAPES
jgi:tetratricopeptide (TPR) repeat protein